MECRIPGKLCSSQPDGWKKFANEFKIYLIASNNEGKSSKKRVALFLNVGGEECVDLFNQLELSLETPFKDVLDRFEEYFQPQTNLVFERFLFFQMKQEEGEPTEEFVSRLSKQASKCKFQDDSIVRDIFIIGVQSKDVKSKLLSKSDLTLVEAINMARKCDALSKEITAMSPRSSQCDAVTSDSQFVCKYCGLTHTKGKCPAFRKVCNYCKTLNHFEKVCFKKESEQKKNSPEQKKESEQKKISEITSSHVEQGPQTSNIEGEGDSDFYLDTISSQACSGDWNVSTLINGHPLALKIDTGAQCNVLPLLVLKKLCSVRYITENLQRTKVQLMAYGGNQLNVFGEIVLPVYIKNRTADVRFVIVSTSSRRAILGLQSCEQLQLVKRIDNIDMEK
uniref:Peptidase A2 domain-containing protein n=1 Tax=Cacopsylla melanoneura TaxID=428564 RepID=A0A8D9B8L6_9HEMI